MSSTLALRLSSNVEGASTWKLPADQELETHFRLPVSSFWSCLASGTLTSGGTLAKQELIAFLITGEGDAGEDDL